VDSKRSRPGERADAAAWLVESRAWFEALLERGGDESSTPNALAEAMRYALTGGKRLRPALVRMSCRWLGGRDADAELAALAIEHVHAYSLVHDDLPCMDDDDTRHGRPSCHVQFGEAMAVLVGDALLTRAFAYLACGEPRRCAASVACLASAAGHSGMVGGQVLDLTLGADAQSGAIELMHGMKTAALIRAACELGALCAGAGDELARVRAYGENLGLCFQAMDDVLDVTADKAELGKTPGKDAKLQRATLVAVLGVDGARRRAREHAERARVAAVELGGELQPTAIALIDHLLDRRK
jgi:geranylgeranyl pyrophosphate synthase